MKRLIPFLALSASLCIVTPPRAQEPHLDLVHGLRAKNYSDLALEYLKELSKRKDLPKDLVQQLPLEMARAQLEMASNESEAGRKTALYASAQKQFEAYLKANPAAPQSAEARLDLARIVGLLGKMHYQKALELKGDARRSAMQEARAQLKAAGKNVVEAENGIAALLAKDNKNPKLLQAKIDAELDKALNLLDLMITYDPSKEAKDHGKVAAQALNALKKLAGDHADNAVGWVARAWIVKYYDEIDARTEAGEELKKFQGKGKQVEPGRRLARAFYIHMMGRKTLGAKDANAEIIKHGKDWLADYGSFAQTAEGNGVRFYLAQAYGSQAAERSDQAGADMNQAAEKLYEQLEQDQSEYAERARLFRVAILLKRRPELLKGKIEDLANFKDCFLRAQLEVAQMEKKGGKKSEVEQHQKNVVAAVRRALELIDDRTTMQERIDARFLLLYYLLVLNRPYEAAVQGEDLAKTYPLSSRAGTAGAYALHAYAQILEEDDKTSSPDAVKDVDRARLFELATYVERNWKSEPAADAARHQLGNLALRDKDFAKAVAALKRITPAYALYLHAQFQLGSAALQAQKEKIPPPQGEPSWNVIASTAFEKMAEPKKLDNVDDARFYFYAKIELAKIYFAEKKYDDMDRIVSILLGRLPKIDNRLRDEVAPFLTPLPIYARFGKADIEYHSDHKDRNAKVCALLDPVIKDLADGKLAKVDPTLQRSVIGLALKANVLDGKIARANAILDLLQKSAGDFENQGLILVDLVQQFTRQIDDLDKKGNKAEKDKMVAQLSAFLDELAKQPLDKMKPEILRFLSYSYSGLGKHEQAAQLLEKVPKPPDGTKDEDMKFYYTIRLMLAHELRLSQKLDPAQKILKELKETKWGGSSLDLRKEEIYLIEGRGHYGSAANAWNKMTQDLQRAMARNAQLKDSYHEAFYRYVYCMVKYALGNMDEKKKKEFLARAARLIVTLEANDQMGIFKTKYQDLLQKESALKLVYDEMKKEQAGAAKQAGTP